MTEIKTIMEVADETYSYEEMTKRIIQLEKDVDHKSKFRILIGMIKNAHSKNHGKPYSFTEQMKMLIVTLGGQFAFVRFG